MQLGSSKIEENMSNSEICFDYNLYFTNEKELGWGRGGGGLFVWVDIVREDTHIVVGPLRV